MSTDKSLTPQDPKDIYADIKGLILLTSRKVRYAPTFLLLGSITFLAQYFVQSTPGDGASSIVRLVAVCAFALAFILLIVLVGFDFAERRLVPRSRSRPRRGTGKTLPRKPPRPRGSIKAGKPEKQGFEDDHRARSL